MKSWMLYGAYGYTGSLIAQEAKNRGHSPVLAGRSAEKLIPFAKKLDLNYIVLDLNDDNILTKTVNEFDLVFHSAGPYKFTSAPMVRACLKTSTNYVDITGEIPVFEQNFEHDAQAKDNGMAIISGVGFDVVPTDCLAKYVSEKITKPTSLDLGIVAMSNPSPGTLKTMLEHYNIGQLIRRNGILKPIEKEEIRKIRFSDKERTVRPVTWGDLSTAYRTTGIPNITTYFPLPKKFPNLLGSIGVSPKELLENKESKKNVDRWIEENVHGPDDFKRKTYRCYISASVYNDQGKEAHAWLETMESYRFTAVAGVRSVEKLFDVEPTGVLTPALAFGKDFILEIPETKRFDSIN
ncbi:MAG: saccharopine dehydrogenase family protein [Candidatus Thorarchaeota archaeon]